MTIEVRLRAVWVERVGYRYDTILNGEVLARGSRDPEFDTARVLLARGLRGRFRTVDFTTGRHRMAHDIEKAAGYCTVERDDRGPPRVVRYRPLPADVRSHLRGQPLHRGEAFPEEVVSGTHPTMEAPGGEGVVKRLAKQIVREEA
jgi:hypothetical protein